MADEAGRTVDVPTGRLDAWVRNFHTRHGESVASATRHISTDGSWFEVRSPFGGEAIGPDQWNTGPALPADWGVLLVRRGGFAVARVRGSDITASKVGQRHVQGRTKAGGQSQQRFARRRQNQTRVAFDAAADHAARILAGLEGPLVIGGDLRGLETTLAEPRLTRLLTVPHPGHVQEPRRAILESVVERWTGWSVTVHNAPSS